MVSITCHVLAHIRNSATCIGLDVQYSASTVYNKHTSNRKSLHHARQPQLLRMSLITTRVPLQSCRGSYLRPASLWYRTLHTTSWTIGQRNVLLTMSSLIVAWSKSRLRWSVSCAFAFSISGMSSSIRVWAICRSYRAVRQWATCMCM